MFFIGVQNHYCSGIPIQQKKQGCAAALQPAGKMV